MTLCYEARVCSIYFSSISGRYALALLSFGVVLYDDHAVSKLAQRRRTFCRVVLQFRFEKRSLRLTKWMSITTHGLFNSELLLRIA